MRVMKAVSSSETCVNIYQTKFLFRRSWDHMLARRLAILSIFVAFLTPPGECQDRTLKLSHNLFLPNTFHLIIHLSPFHMAVYSLVTGKSVTK
jgi:hypothetical protein